MRRAWPTALFGFALLLVGCAQVAPLTRAPATISEDDLDGVTTRDEAVRRFGEPAEIRSSDIGPILVYRRTAVVDINPNHFYGVDYDERYRQYELLLLYVDAEGKIVRRSVERE